MATPYSQLDQRGRSAHGLSVSTARLKRVADKVRAQRFMDQAVEIFQPLTFAEAEVKIRDLEFTPLENVKTVQVPVGASEEAIAEAILADAAPAPEPDKAFCVEIERDGVWERVPECGTSDRARDLEQDAIRTARKERGRKVRVIRCEGENRRAVLRFKVWQTGVLGSY